MWLTDWLTGAQTDGGRTSYTGVSRLVQTKQSWQKSRRRTPWKRKQKQRYMCGQSGSKRKSQMFDDQSEKKRKWAEKLQTGTRSHFITQRVKPCLTEQTCVCVCVCVKETSLTWKSKSLVHLKVLCGSDSPEITPCLSLSGSFEFDVTGSGSCCQEGLSC